MAEILFIFISVCLAVGIAFEIFGLIPNGGVDSGDFPK